MPTRLQFLKALPRNPNGKIDRNSVAVLVAATPAPSGPQECTT
jgi:hypothetical protein